MNEEGLRAAPFKVPPQGLLLLTFCFASACATHQPERATQGPESAPAQQGAVPAPPPSASAQADAPEAPPAVLTGEGRLDCTISNSKNGTQKLTLSDGGQGLEFDVAVSPIVDGVVQQKGPSQGGSYRFTSHLAAPGKGTLSGIGDVTIEALETKVNVAMDRYQQAGGPGTEISFASEDMARRGIYVEFSGRARAQNGDAYAFRVTLGAPGQGSGGKVKPTSDAENTHIYAKSVVVRAATTTVITTRVNKLP